MKQHITQLPAELSPQLVPVPAWTCVRGIAHSSRVFYWSLRAGPWPGTCLEDAIRHRARFWGDLGEMKADTGSKVSCQLSSIKLAPHATGEPEEEGGLNQNDLSPL